MTSNDRHANHDSPHRAFAGNTHQPLAGGVGRTPRLSSVVSPGSEVSLNRPYHDDANHSTTALHTNTYSPRSPPNGVGSPTTPYSPGMRSASVAGATSDGQPGGIALQDFGADGTPPAPPVHHSWERIDVWAEENYPELWDQLCTPASVNDINELEYSLDCSLPMEIRESLMIHDGQERGGRPTGTIFGAMLMDCEEILDEWRNWRVVDRDYLAEPVSVKGASNEAGPSSAAASLGRANLQSRQDCQPEGSVQKIYSHPGWIPLVRDWGGNYIAVDLAPGPKGTWGQIILFGRDYDCKFVVSKSWAHFLAMVADDMSSPHWYVDEESGELKLRDPRAPRSEPSFMEILRVRNERKFGRRRPVRSRPGSLPGSRPGSAPGSPHLSANGAGSRGGLTRPPKESDNMDKNHLKPPSKKAAKALRSVSEEPTPPAPAVTTSKDTAGSTLLDEPFEEIKISPDEKKTENNQEDGKLKRQSSDLILDPPVPVTKPTSVQA
jgi:cell wall assembly regulator SMI1